MSAPSDDDRDSDLLRRAAAGDGECWGALLGRHRDRLRRMVALRLDHRLQGRLDPSDVVQEAYLEAFERLDDYVRQPDYPFFLWLRFLTGQKLITLHRHHFGVHMRDVSREVPLATPDATSAALAAQLLAHDPRPSEVATRREAEQRFQNAIDSLDPLDREILALRHFEQLTNAEAARVLGLQESTASKRYIRAVRRLKEELPESDA